VDGGQYFCGGCAGEFDLTIELKYSGSFANSGIPTILGKDEMAKTTTFWIAVILGGILLLVVILFILFVGDNFPVPVELALMQVGPGNKESPGDLFQASYLETRVRYLEQYIELFRVIVVGVVVALASVLIPLVYSQAKAKFERYKEARSAYSKAKTGVLYLRDRVLEAYSQGNEAGPEETEASVFKVFKLIETAHRELHLAETFENDIIKQGILEWYEAPKTWVLHNYWRIVAIADVVRYYLEQLEKGRSDEQVERELNLRNLLNTAWDKVEEAFGKDVGGQWEIYAKEKVEKAENSFRSSYRISKEDILFWRRRKKRDLEKLRRWTREDALKSKIKQVLNS